MKIIKIIPMGISWQGTDKDGDKFIWQDFRMEVDESGDPAAHACVWLMKPKDGSPQLAAGGGTWPKDWKDEWRTAVSDHLEKLAIELVKDKWDAVPSKEDTLLHPLDPAIRIGKHSNN